MEAKEQGLLKSRFESLELAVSDEVFEKISLSKQQGKKNKWMPFAIAASFSLLILGYFGSMPSVQKNEIASPVVKNSRLAETKERHDPQSQTKHVTEQKIVEPKKEIPESMLVINQAIDEDEGFLMVEAVETPAVEQETRARETPDIIKAEKPKGSSVKIQLVFLDPAGSEEKPGLGKKIRRFKRKLKKEVDLKKMKKKAKSVFAVERGKKRKGLLKLKKKENEDSIVN